MILYSTVPESAMALCMCHFRILRTTPISHAHARDWYIVPIVAWYSVFPSEWKTATDSIVGGSYIQHTSNKLMATDQQHFLSEVPPVDLLVTFASVTLIIPWLVEDCGTREVLSFLCNSSTIFSNDSLTFSPFFAEVKKFNVVFSCLHRARMVSCSISRGKSHLLPTTAHTKLSGSQGIMLEWRFSIHSCRFWKLSISSTLYMRMAADALR